MRHRGLVLGGIEDLDGGPADLLVVAADQLDHRFDHAAPADLGQRVGGAGAHPPVLVLERVEQILHRVRILHAVEHLDGGAAHLLGLVLEQSHQVDDGAGGVETHQGVDGLVLHVHVAVAQQAAEDVDVQLDAHPGQRLERHQPHLGAAVVEPVHQRVAGVVQVELAEQPHHAETGVDILRRHPADQLGNQGFVGDLFDDLEQRDPLAGREGIGLAQQRGGAEALLARFENLQQRRFRDLVVIEQRQQVVGVIGPRGGQHPHRGAEHAGMHGGRQAGDVIDQALVVQQVDHDLPQALQLGVAGGFQPVEQRGNRRVGDGTQILQAAAAIGIEQVCRIQAARQVPAGAKLSQNAHQQLPSCLKNISIMRFPVHQGRGLPVRWRLTAAALYFSRSRIPHSGCVGFRREQGVKTQA